MASGGLNQKASSAKVTVNQESLFTSQKDKSGGIKTGVDEEIDWEEFDWDQTSEPGDITNDTTQDGAVDAPPSEEDGFDSLPEQQLEDDSASEDSPLPTDEHEIARRAQVFAQLRPANAEAQALFDRATNSVETNTMGDLDRYLDFMDSYTVARNSSNLESLMLFETAPEKYMNAEEDKGCYELSFDYLPANVAEGWNVGFIPAGSKGHSRVTLLLGTLMESVNAVEPLVVCSFGFHKKSGALVLTSRIDKAVEYLTELEGYRTLQKGEICMLYQVPVNRIRLFQTYEYEFVHTADQSLWPALRAKRNQVLGCAFRTPTAFPPIPKFSRLGNTVLLEDHQGARDCRNSELLYEGIHCYTGEPVTVRQLLVAPGITGSVTMKDVRQGFGLDLLRSQIPENYSRGLLHVIDSFGSHMDPQCEQSPHHFYIVTPAYEFKFSEFNFRELDSSKALALYYQTLVGVADIARCNMAHLEIRRCNMVVLCLTPPEARLANFSVLHRADESDLQQESRQDLHMWAMSIAQSKLNEDGFAWELHRPKLRDHARQLPEDAPLCNLLLRILEVDPQKEVFTAEQALQHPCWDVLQQHSIEA